MERSHTKPIHLSKFDNVFNFFFFFFSSKRKRGIDLVITKGDSLPMDGFQVLRNKGILIRQHIYLHFLDLFFFIFFIIIFFFQDMFELSYPSLSTEQPKGHRKNRSNFKIRKSSY
jgi:hypothetical protein